VRVVQIWPSYLSHVVPSIVQKTRDFPCLAFERLRLQVNGQVFGQPGTLLLCVCMYLSGRYPFHLVRGVRLLRQSQLDVIGGEW